MTKLLSQFLSEPTEVVAVFAYLGILTNAVKDVIIARLSSAQENPSNSTPKKKRKKK